MKITKMYRTIGGVSAALLTLSFALVGSAQENKGNAYDVIIKNGRIIDGSGNPWVSGDIAIRGDRIAKIGKLDASSAKRIIDAQNLVVSPGFIDMLGQSETALLIDNRSLSKLSQGITSEITGEGNSAAPQNALTLAELQPELDHYHLTVDWTTLDGYFTRLEKSGTPLNIGTYVGAAQVREAIIGGVDRAPTPQELEKMKALVAEAMQQGAFGVSTALIYPPGHYAKTDELIELAKVAARYGGIYASHMRSEGQSETAALEEALRSINEFDWIVFASRYAVAAVTERVAAPPANLRVAAVGQATAQVLGQRGWPVDILPEDASAAALVSLFATKPIAGMKVLFPASSRALPTIAAGLTQLGAKVVQVEAYRTEPAALDVDACRSMIDRGGIGAVTFASPSAVIELERSLGKDSFDRLLEGAKAVAIGPTTARELAARGRAPVLAESATLRGLALTTLRLVQTRQ